MGCSDVPTAVFTETNLGTRLAVPASPDITAEDFKREVERTHLNCFPEFGTIRVKAVMSSKHNKAEVRNLGSAELGGASSEKRIKCKRKIKVRRFTYLKASVLKISIASCFCRKRKRKNMKKKPKMRHPRRGRMQHSLVEKEMLCEFATGAEANLSKKSDSKVIAEDTGEMVSEPASVSGIIKKYFSDYDEVASNPESPLTTAQYKRRKQLNHSPRCEYPNMQMMSPITVHIPPQVSEASRERHKRPDIGKRLLVASGSLGLFPSNRRSILSLCRYNYGESPFHELSATARFEMADEGD